MKNTATQRLWSSQSVFLFAAIGAAVGLGNIWRFPYMAGANGGGAFILLYIIFVMLLCIPLVTAELFIGSRGRQSPIASMQKLTKEKQINTHWHIIGWLCIVISFLVFSFYSVVAGWSLDYFAHYLIAIISSNTSNTSQSFDELLSSPHRLIFWHSLVVLFTAAAVAAGIKNGLERVLKVLLPGLAIILVLLVVLAAATADFHSAATFLFSPDFSKINISVVLMALGQAFFSVAAGGGALMTYGAYLPSDVSIMRMATTICIADTLVALIAGLAIFPFVFSYGLNPSEGPGLIFVALTAAFEQMPGGQPLAALFFLLLSLAALTTTLALLEPIISWLEEYGKWSRPLLTFMAASAIWILGIGNALSFNILKEFAPLAFIPLLKEMNLFTLSEHLVSNVLLPLNCFLIAVFVGWIYIKNTDQERLSFSNNLQHDLWLYCVRLLVPIAIITAFGLTWIAS